MKRVLAQRSSGRTRQQVPRMAGGFTLVEVVVALVILSLVMLATLTALRTFANTQTSVDQLINRVDQLRSVSGFLRDSLEAAVGDAGSTAGGLGFGASEKKKRGYFRGDARELVWKAPVILGASFGGTLLLRLAHEEDRLVLQWQKPPRQLTEAQWLDQPSRVLVEDVREFEVRYRASFDQPSVGRWKGPDAPAQVSMVIKSGEHYWPELIVQVAP